MPYDNRIFRRDDGRQLDSGSPTYNELLDMIANVETGETMVSDPEAEHKAMQELNAATVQEEQVRVQDAPRHAQSLADPTMPAPKADGKVALPDYTAQGVNSAVVAPGDALADSPAANPVETGKALPLYHADREAQAQKSTGAVGNTEGKETQKDTSYPDGSSAPFYSAPEEGEGPGTPTPEQAAGFANYNASPDDLPRPNE